MEQIINSIGHMSPSLVDHAEPLLSGTGYFLEFLYDFSHLMFLIVFFLLLFESEIEYRYFMIDIIKQLLHQLCLFLSSKCRIKCQN